MRSRRSGISRVGYRDQEQKQGGMNCPGCGAHLPVTLEGLLSGGRFTCPNGRCRGTLRLDTGASAEALNVLRRYKRRQP